MQDRLIPPRTPIEKAALAFGSKEYEEQAEELVQISANLTDREKMISEYWSDGPNSEQPPGHWMLFAQWVSARDHHTLDNTKTNSNTKTEMETYIASGTASGARHIDGAPPCNKCGDSVSFELVRGIPALQDRDFHIRLYVIPHPEAA